MARGSGVTVDVLPRPLFIAHARTRLIAAIFVSAVLHVSLSSLMTGGHVGAARPAASHPILTVRLVDAAPSDSTLRSLIGERAVVAPRLSAPAMPAARPAAASVANPRAVESPMGSGATVAGPDLTYYPAKQLDVYPALASELDLRTLGKAASGSSARAQLLVLIDEVGVVTEVSIVEGEPASRFEEARRAFLGAGFTPAYKNGRAVRSRVLVEVNIVEERAAR